MVVTEGLAHMHRRILIGMGRPPRQRKDSDIRAASGVNANTRFAVRGEFALGFTITLISSSRNGEKVNLPVTSGFDTAEGLTM